MRDLAGGPRRFVELQRTLPGISTEQLRSRLNRMVADDLLTRARYREVPPRVDYELTERARALLPVVAELARWGAEWAWGAPRPGENVDIGAILRAGTGRAIPHDVEGTVGIVVRDTARGPRVYSLTATDGRLEYSEHTTTGAETRVSGTVSAFVEAFGPAQSRGGLEIDGDGHLANLLLDEFAAAGNGRAVA